MGRHLYEVHNSSCTKMTLFPSLLQIIISLVIAFIGFIHRPIATRAARVRTSSDAASCACMSEFQSTSNRILCRSWWRGNATSGKPCLWANASISCMHSSKEATELSRQLSAQSRRRRTRWRCASTLHVIAVFCIFAGLHSAKQCWQWPAPHRGVEMIPKHQQDCAIVQAERTWRHQPPLRAISTFLQVCYCM